MSPADTPQAVAAHQSDRLAALFAVLPENPFYARKLAGILRDENPSPRSPPRSGEGGEF